MADFYYKDGEYLQGILKWEHFVERNAKRTLLDIQRWHELRSDWFDANGYSRPKDDTRENKEPTQTSYHASLLKKSEDPDGFTKL